MRRSARFEGEGLGMMEGGSLFLPVEKNNAVLVQVLDSSLRFARPSWRHESGSIFHNFTSYHGRQIGKAVILSA